MFRPVHMIPLALAAAASFAAPARAQTAADSAAIRATALDYIDGWYTGDSTRMRRALHPDLAKRIVRRAANGGGDRLEHATASDMVQWTSRGGGSRTPAAERRNGVRILDVFGDVASVRVDAGTWIDYLHLARSDGRWVIVNVLWETR